MTFNNTNKNAVKIGKIFTAIALAIAIAAAVLVL
jgi:hypothetical protein